MSVRFDGDRGGQCVPTRLSHSDRGTVTQRGMHRKKTVSAWVSTCAYPAHHMPLTRDDGLFISTSLRCVSASRKACDGGESKSRHVTHRTARREIRGAARCKRCATSVQHGLRRSHKERAEGTWVNAQGDHNAPRKTEAIGKRPFSSREMAGTC